jgi:hypothetical protein
VLAGWAVYLVLAHPGGSQAYFIRLANPLASVFGAWALAAAVPATARSGRWVAAVLAGGTVIGIGVVTLARAAARTLVGQPEGLASIGVSFLVPLAVAGSAVVAGLLVWVLVRHRVPALGGWGSAVVLAALVVGAPAQGVIRISEQALVDVVADRPLAVAATPLAEGRTYRLSSGAAAAMAWVEQNTPNDAVIATNRHCISGPQKRWCLATAAWVSGIGGRRTVLEGWGNTSAANWAWRAANPFPARLAVNDAVFTRAAVSTIARLRHDYGASWLVADSSAGPVSPELSRFATPRFSSGPITVYELR